MPLVVTLRGSDILGVNRSGWWPTFYGRLLRQLSRLVATRSDAVIVVAEHMRDRFSSSAPVHVIPSGLDFDLFKRLPQTEARQRLGLPEGERLVLRLQPGERREARRSCQAVGGDTQREIARQADRRLGRASRRDSCLYERMQCFVFTSGQEGSPNVVKEALACDLPVVSVAVGDVRQRLQGVEGCEVCADDRPETIAAALERALRRGGRIRGREAVQWLDEKLLTKKVIDIYRSVVWKK